MNTLRRLEILRNKIALDYPFYGYHLIMMDLQVDNSTETACTNGKYIKCNEDFVNNLSDNHVKMLLMHEAKHVIFLHHVRRRGRDISKWNEAGDYVINWSLKHEDRLELMENILYDPKYAEYSVEQVYNTIGEKNDTRRQNQNSTGDIEGSGQTNREDNNGEHQTTDRTKIRDDNESNNGQGKKSNKYIGEVVDGDSNSIEEEERIKEITVQAIKYAEKAGKMPGNVKRRITEMLKPKISWERLLANWMDSKTKDDYSWLSRNNRILDYYFPALEDESLGKIGIAIDSSGSIDQNLFNRFLTEINGLRYKYKFDTIIIDVDTKVNGVGKFNKNQKVELDVRGGGGTAFKPAFDFFKDKNIIGMIYFTDMYAYDLQELKRPRYDVLWMDYGRGVETKFGKHIKMERNR